MTINQVLLLVIAELIQASLFLKQMIEKFAYIGL